MSQAKKKNKGTIRRVPLSRLNNESAKSIPDSNIINLREVLLQKEVERLKTELEKKQKSTTFNKLTRGISDVFLRSGYKTSKKKVKIDHELEGPKEFIAPTPETKKTSGIKISWPRWKLQPGGIKSLIGFCAICILIILPIFSFWGYQYLMDLRSRVVDISLGAFNQLVLAGEAATEKDYLAAQQRFTEASDTFLLAQNELNQIGGSLLTILKYVPFKGKILSSGQNLLEAGEEIALAGQELTRLIETYNPDVSPDNSFIRENSMIDLLKTSQGYIQPAKEHISKATDYLMKVDANTLPEEYRADIQQVKDQLPLLEDDFNQFVTFSDLFYNLLGGESSKRYLLIFQNNRELRATGGFIGSLALIDIKNGVIEKLEVPGGGPYDFQGQLTEKVIAPAPLQLVNPHWYLQDANWFPDWPTSAEKIMWFYEKSGGPTVDGIISVTPDLIIDLLKIIGSIDLQSTYGVTITSENFIEETLNQVELEYDKEENRPKQFIADLLPIVLDRVFESNQNEFLTIVSALSDSLKKRQLLFYLNNKEWEDRIKDLDWGGEIKQTASDYLMVVNSNISGGKTDAVIDQTVNHQVQIQPNGEAIATVEITRLHTGQVGEQWTGVKNIDFLRLYTPQGSELISAEGFEQPDPKLFKWPEPEYQVDEDLKEIEGTVIIDEQTGTRINNEFGKTVFGNWVQVEPGSSVTIRFVYRLPFRLNTDNLINSSTPYSLLVQQQSGGFESVFQSQIFYPENYNIIWQWPDESELIRINSSLKIEGVLDSDLYLGAVFQK